MKSQKDVSTGYRPICSNGLLTTPAHAEFSEKLPEKYVPYSYR